MSKPIDPDQLPCGVVYTDWRARITAVNRYLTDWLGYAETELVGRRRFYDLLTVGGKLFYETHHAPKLDLNGAVRELNYEMVDANGKRFPVLVNAHLTDGGYVHVIVPFEDRGRYEAQLREARSRAETADRAKSDFLSTMSHEIRTPLHAILQAGKMLTDGEPRPEQTEIISILRNAGTNLLAIVNDLLDLDKLEAGKVVLDQRPFEPADLIDGVMATYRHLARQQNLELRRYLVPERPAAVVGDAGKLAQVLNNLVSNAIKFTAEGSVGLRLITREQDRYSELRFAVADTGIGISPDRLRAIFDPFTQAKRTTANDYGGTGLGLSISQRLVSAFGGQLSVSSEPGKGTTFSFTLHLPRAELGPSPATAPAAPPQKTPTLPPLPDLRVLNVDDSKANLFINRRYFRNWQLPHDQAGSGTEALGLLARNEYSLALLDLQMPGMDGYELARRIRAAPEPWINRLPLVALTATAAGVIRDRLAEAGIHHHLLKPFESRELHATIDRLARRPFSPAAVDFSELDARFADAPAERREHQRSLGQDLRQLAERLPDLIDRADATTLAPLARRATAALRTLRLEELTDYLAYVEAELIAGRPANARRGLPWLVPPLLSLADYLLGERSGGEGGDSA